MALQIRRGVDGSGAGGRLTVTPNTGELLYTTDTKKLYIGDGSTAGGTLVTGIDNVVEDLTPQLGGNLDVNGHSIVSTSDGNINIDAHGDGNVVLQAELRINALGNINKTGDLNITPTTVLSIGRSDTLVDGNLTILRNSYSSAFGQGFTFQQHHATADAVNLNFFRTRGTAIAPTAVVNGDDIADLNFIGHDGTNRASIGGITARVAGVVSTGIVPGQLVFDTRSLSGVLTENAMLTSEGVWKVNGIENFSGTDLTLTATTVKVVGDVQINAQGDLRFADSDSSNYVAFQAPAVVSSNITWTLPDTTGDAGQVLTAAGSGTLQWSVPVASTAPLTATSAGTVGQIAFDASYIYVCVASGTWVRAALATWS